jgi:general secretion pathway protein F
MPVFAYKGMDSRGQAVKGMKEADSGKVLRAILRKDGVFVTDFKETKSGADTKSKGKGLKREVDLGGLLGRIKPQETAVFTRQLATLLRAGIPLAESLAALIDQIEHQRVREIITDVRRRVNEGSSLAAALEAHPKMFEPLYVNMVRSGEAAGNLDQVLFQLADFTDSQIALRAKILSALLYPMIMVVVGSGIMIVLMVVVVPQITQLFADMDKALPWNTQLLIAVSGFMGEYWWVLILGGVLAWLVLRYWKKTPKGKKRWDRMRLKLPIFGDLGRKVAISRFGATLGTMLGAGVPLLRALEIVKNVLGNVILEGVVEDSREAIKEGEPIAAPLKRSGEFPPLMVHMIAVGERSGQLETMLGNVAAAYQNEVERKLERLTTMLEPIMILVMGGGVAFVVFSVLMPILQMNQMVQ